MYQVLHVRKIKNVVGLKNVAAHNSRENIYNEVGQLQEGVEVPEWLNADVLGTEYLSENQVTNLPEQMSFRVLKEREKLCEGLKRKPQKNASAAIEFTISASPEFKGDWNKFFGKAETFLRKKFGENCIQFTVHHDETTPHLHCLFVPIVEKNGVRKYSSSEFLGGKIGLQKLHTEFYEQVGKRFGLERGEVGSRAKHNELKNYREMQNKVLEKQRDVLERSIALREATEKWQKQKEAEEAVITTQKNALKTLSEALETRQKGLDEKNIDLTQKNANLSVLERSLNEQEKQINDKAEKLEEWQKMARENSFDVFQEVEQFEKSGMISWLATRSFMQKVKASLTSAWHKVSELLDKNKKLEKQLELTSHKLGEWQNKTPEQLEEVANNLRRHNAKNYVELLEKNKIRKSKSWEFER